MQKLNAGDYAGAADQFLRWNHAGKTVMPGLTERAAMNAVYFSMEFTPLISSNSVTGHGGAMFRRLLILALCCFVPAAASGADFCQTLANGNWVIVSAKGAPVTALSYQEAHGFIGKRVFVSEQKVTVGDLQCRIAKQTIDYYVDELTGEPGFPYTVIYSCQSKDVYIPGFNVGKSCEKILAEDDGWTFVLRRAK